MAYHILKHVAGLSRMTQAFFNERLAPYGLGAGQQFFMDRIARYPGLSMAELAHMGFFDNCTATRAVRRLTENGYVRMEPDKKDGRIKRLYATEKAEELLSSIRGMRRDWYEIITAGLAEEEKQMLGGLLSRMADNACAQLEKNYRPEEGEDGWHEKNP